MVQRRSANRKTTPANPPALGPNPRLRVCGPWSMLLIQEIIFVTTFQYKKGAGGVPRFHNGIWIIANGSQRIISSRQKQGPEKTDCWVSVYSVYHPAPKNGCESGSKGFHRSWKMGALPCLPYTRGVKLIFTGGHISLVVAFKGRM